MDHTLATFFLLASLGCAPAALAEQLHKCVAADGHASYQSTPCPPSAATAWVHDYVPDTRPEPPREYSRPPPAAVAARASRATSPRQQAHARCRAAREHEAAMRRAHPTLGYEQSSALSDAKTHACRGAR